MSEKVQALIEETRGLTVLGLAEIVKAMEGEFGVSAVTSVAVVGTTPAAGGVAGGVEKKTDFGAVITEPGQGKVKVIKVVEDITSLGLKEVKALVGGTPKVTKEGTPQAEADEIKTKFEEAGATVEVE